MADVLLEKNIYFLGSWKANRLSDHLLHDITSHDRDNKGAPTVLQVLRHGIKLIMNESPGQTGKSGIIPEKNVLEIKQNRFQPTTVLCVVKDDSSLLLNIMVWRCANQKDVYEIMKSLNVKNINTVANGHSDNVVVDTNGARQQNNGNVPPNVAAPVSESRKYRKKGQGHSLITTSNIKQTITTNPDKYHMAPSRQDSNESNGNISVIDIHSKTGRAENVEPVKVVYTPKDVNIGSQTHEDSAILHTRIVSVAKRVDECIGSRDVCVQTDIQDSDTESVALSTSGSIKDELFSLQKEVKELRLLVENTVAISNAEYIRRKQQPESQNSTLGIVQFVNDGHNSEEYDSRSFASQTEVTRRVYGQSRKSRVDDRPTSRRPRVQSEPRYVFQASQIHSPHPTSTRSHRFQSDSVMYDHHGYQVIPQHHKRSPDSSASGTFTRKMQRFVTLPPEKKVVNKEARRTWRNDQRRSGLFLHSTVERPIENVYAGQKSRKSRIELKERRSRKIVTPSTFQVFDNGVHVSNGTAVVQENIDNQKLVNTKYIDMNANRQEQEMNS